jgi:hypothetical protein
MSSVQEREVMNATQSWCHEWSAKVFTHVFLRFRESGAASPPGRRAADGFVGLVDQVDVVDVFLVNT